MRKFLSYILPGIVVALALIPFIDIYIMPPPHKYWPYFMAIVGFLGMYILFLKTNIIIKLISVLVFVNCFFSAAPYMSFNQYVSVLACCYFYIGLTRMEYWGPMFNVLKTLLIFNSLLIAIQLVGHDSLFNFGLDRIASYGVVGHHMQMGSFSVVLASCLSIVSPWFFLFPVIVGIICNSAWTLLCAYIGITLTAQSKIVRIAAIIILIIGAVICVRGEKFHQAFSQQTGRIVVWKKSLEMLNDRPVFGWGPGSYKYIFPALSNLRSFPWKTAHNDFVQIAFELGYVMFAYFIMGWFWVLFKAIRIKQWAFLAGFLVISIDMLVHFPMRMIQCVPIMIVFLAYYDSALCKEIQPFRTRANNSSRN